ncbi:hypothetical protein [Paraconexibacter algicola]|uniref:DUF5667 domain-containing protein n=1 Tax=Paraconexibacter algicola TaxID=2133960 RepID=A0A2T4UH05_9ACTN|nr:hypothetical protein [Paraconexibacter algicola]PTL58531.1 hypothetical protein C7Y72_02095 [Paraconexibacter algicola]
MSITRKAGALALVAGLAAGVPTAAQADRGDHVKAPTRIASKLKSAERALERAQDRADDGETAGAVSSLTASRRHLASATGSAVKRVTAAASTGEAAAAAVTRTDHRIVGGAAAILDGAGEDVSTAATTTIDAALDGRDRIVAAIAALGEDDKADYADVLDRIVEHADDEIDELAETAADDELTDAATTALGEAATQIAATRTAAQAQLDAIEGADEDSGYPTDDSGYPTDVADRPSGDRGDCPRPGGRPHGPRPGAGQQQPADDLPAGSYGT